MAGSKQPTNLVLLKGNKHLTKEEIAERLSTEVVAPADNVEAPKWLSKKQKQIFDNIAIQLVELGIMSNLDCEALARYILSQESYLKYQKMISTASKGMKTVEKIAEKIILIEKLEGMKDKAFKQCRAAASDLGLTISSRCKLVIPKAPEAPKANKFAKFEKCDSS